ncbi:DNA topoisomerase III [Apostasia shenzhenica]|uniref:DNA topoisomerase III n=1 Tax=Apostasia shenzhenica TaxID=1088818 RepID=A0A2H9ZUK8_9ASPA|nr:DNA topoisomerase III [Apostasia shenzhenica]
MSSSHFSSSRTDNYNNQVLCGCNLECTILTARKGDNKGKRFYRCPHFKKSGDCQFFQWVDDAHFTIVDLKYLIIASEEKNMRHLDNIVKLIKIVLVLLLMANIMIFLLILK